MSLCKVFCGALGLFAAGVMVGVLFAPEKGEVTRKRIAETTADIADEINSRADDLKENVTETIDTVKDEADRLKRKLKR